MNRLPILLVAAILFSCGNKRTQEPVEPLPYASGDVNFKSLAGDVTLAGTLTTPLGDTSSTAVVLVGGSGPGDRNYTNRFGHRPFLVLSDYLTRSGLTVLRYDERGVGQSEGRYPEATRENLVDDIAGGVQYLRQKGFKKIGIIGHSEGGGLAPVVAQKAAVDFLVLMAPPNTTVRNITLHQVKRSLREVGASESIGNEVLSTVDSLLSILQGERTPAAAKAKMEALIAQKEKSASPEYNTITRQMGDVHRLIEGWLDPKFILALNNPIAALKTLTVPVLILYGDEDGAVDVAANLPAQETALNSIPHQIKVFHGLGHLFMNSQGVPIDKLHTVEETLAPEVLETINTWIQSL
ncbi:MAG TPA: alpha/beta hydrolase [Chryseolinea sp.]